MKLGFLPAVLALASLLPAEEAPPPDRGVQATREMVRGDSGKWNDGPLLQIVPPLAEKPPGMSLDAWGDQLLESPVKPRAGGQVWCLFRSRQLDDNDRFWVESVSRKDGEITVTVREAVWQENYFKTFTCYGVLALNLGVLPAGVRWVVDPLTFTKLDGDGRPLRQGRTSPELARGRGVREGRGRGAGDRVHRASLIDGTGESRGESRGEGREGKKRKKR